LLSYVYLPIVLQMQRIVIQLRAIIEHF